MTEKRQTKSFAYVGIVIIILGEITLSHGTQFPASVVAAFLAAIQGITSRGIHRIVGIIVMLSALALAAVSHREFTHVTTITYVCSVIHTGDSREDVESRLASVQSEVSTEFTDDSVIIRDKYFSMQPLEICRIWFKNGEVSGRSAKYGYSRKYKF